MVGEQLAGYDLVILRHQLKVSSMEQIIVYILLIILPSVELWTEYVRFSEMIF